MRREKEKICPRCGVRPCVARSAYCAECRRALAVARSEGCQVMENKEKFTPWPWRLRHKSYCRIEASDGTPVAQTLLQEPRPYSPFGVMRGGIDATNPERRANAHLIAAAPTMYHELELVRELLNARRKDAGLKSLAQEIEDVLRIARGEK